MVPGRSHHNGFLDLSPSRPSAATESLRRSCFILLNLRNVSLFPDFEGV